jgi:HlyD family secretion protein
MWEGERALSKNALATVRSFQSEIAAIREAPDPIAARITVHVLVALVLAFVAVLIFLRLDRVISSAKGKITLSAPQEVFQALDMSIIKSIDVRTGDFVKKGQELATLDPTFAAADVEALNQQIASLNPQILRDEAELAGKVPVFPAAANAAEAKYIEIQKALYTQRRAQYVAQLNSFQEKEKLAQATLVKTNGDIAGFEKRVSIAEKVEEMRGKLLKSGAGSLLNELVSKDNLVELGRNLENARNTLKEAQAQMLSARADGEAFVQQWQASLSQDLVTARNNRDAAIASLQKAQRRRDLVRLVARDDAIILTVAKLSVGSVLNAGDQFITAMPVDMPVEATVTISTRDIGFLRVGDPATLRVDAFESNEHGYAQGHVKWISEGAFSIDEDTNQPVDPYYKVGVAIDSYHFVSVPKNFRLMPGMTLTADMKVGTRSAGAYLLEGMTRGASEAMREP